MGQIYSIFITTNTYYFGLLHYWWGTGRHTPYRRFKNDNNQSTIAKRLQTITLWLFGDSENEQNEEEEALLFQQHANIHLFSLASMLYLYDKPHYRKGSYRDDLRDNLRNVAIPGTGIPLSLFVTRSKLLTSLFLLTVYPTVSYVAAFHQWMTSKFRSSISKEYAIRLLAPNDWFHFWRLNCNVVGLHALLHNVPKGYEMENKWTFLEEGSRLGVPVSPYLKTPGIVVKHRNEEGGMGIHFYKNATAGGDWIIQETISNSDWVSTLLPSNAPLSTFRVITQSRASIHLDKVPQLEDITALSCVFRAGRQGAATDHDSILFDVDVNTGLIRGGTTNAHWYRLGLYEILPGRCPWRSHHGYQSHPDGNIEVSGKHVPDIKKMLKLVEESHFKMCPDVPLAGWDVVLSADPNVPICLLEVNLSCNFFRGSFNRHVYLDFIDESFAQLQALRLTADAEGKKFVVTK